MKKQDRNFGIDLLRIIAMIFVVVLHSLGQGGIIRTSFVNSDQYKAAWLLEIIAYCAVDIFGLISGYVSYNKTTKVKNYVNLWIQVVFYSLLIVIVFNIIDPNLVTSKNYVISFLPVTNHLYWYFTAFTGLYLIKPILDKAINNMNNNELKKMFIILFLGFSIIDTLIKRFKLVGGHSVIWLIILYLLGAIIHKCEIGKNIKIYKSLIAIIMLIFITYLITIYGYNIIEILEQILNIKIDNDVLVNNTSPTILGIAILLLISFSKMKFTNIFKKIITFGASSAFSVYLLNTNYFVWDQVMLNLFKNIANDSVFKIYGMVLGFSILFVFGAILIDKVRILIFKILRINKLLEKISNLLELCIIKISKNI